MVSNDKKLLSYKPLVQAKLNPGHCSGFNFKKINPPTNPNNCYI
ncbi:hypothetical protein Cflav_PD3327 [Pedosphaera parvula Ellin514]|uniref:Uncharacterized protein n=1 Tax=Pedosphaera parvula (strain Ellin514) TaxID=320771 RepID=B9XI96_PEDPL|nr:hypothetical protein Cflav_PD3327 [Pedosphaera parvula Ellin514]